MTYTGSISKSGDGTLVLSGANTYSGDTTVAGGELVFNAPASGNCLTFVAELGIPHVEARQSGD